VVFTCLKRNLTKEIKVAQLAGSVAEHSAYHHGEVISALPFTWMNFLIPLLAIVAGMGKAFSCLSML